MAKLLLTLDQHERDPSVDASNRSNYILRRAVRAVVSDKNGAIALLHATVRGYYKLPGGGIDENENIAQAMVRELMEEIGSTAEVTNEVGEIIEWYDDRKMKQVSYCFAARLTGEKGTPNFTQQELDEGFEVAWVPDVAEAIKLVGATTNSNDLNVSFMTTRDKAILIASQE